MVQGALKLILEPIFETDFQSGSYGYRPNRTAHAAIDRVAKAIIEEKTRIIDLDLRAYFDNVQHYLLLGKVAKRVRDGAILHLLKMILKATGKKGVRRDYLPLNIPAFPGRAMRPGLRLGAHKRAIRDSPR